MELNNLESAGLTKNESKVYATLLKLGSASVEEISKTGSIYRRCVYDSIDSLNKKGLVGYVTEGKKKLYRASHPNQLLELVKEKEINIKNILPDLLRFRDYATEKQEVSVYPGFDGVKLIFDDIIRTGKDNVAISTHVPDKFIDLTMRWHERRIKAKIYDKVLFSKAVRKWADKLVPMGYTEVRFLPEKYDPKVSMNIYGDKMGLIIWQKDNQPLSVIIRNKSFAESFRLYFEFMWSQSETN